MLPYAPCRVLPMYLHFATYDLAGWLVLLKCLESLVLLQSYCTVPHGCGVTRQLLMQVPAEHYVLYALQPIRVTAVGTRCCCAVCTAQLCLIVLQPFLCNAHSAPENCIYECDGQHTILAGCSTIATVCRVCHIHIMICCCALYMVFEL